MHAAVPLDGSAAEDRSAVREPAPAAHRFVSQARPSPDGRHVAWIAWDHPHMPWDAAELPIVEVDDDGSLRQTRTLTGGPGDPVAQAEWLPNGTLVAACESTGWWNLYTVDTGTGKRRPLHAVAEEFAGLQRLGLRWFHPLSDGRLAVLHGVGAQRLAVLDPERGELTDVPGPADEWPPHLDAAGDGIVGVAASSHSPCTVVEVDTATPALLTSRCAPGSTVDSAYLPLPVPCVFHGPGGRPVHAQVHAPRNPGSRARPARCPRW